MKSVQQVDQAHVSNVGHERREGARIRDWRVKLKTNIQFFQRDFGRGGDYMISNNVELYSQHVLNIGIHYIMVFVFLKFSNKMSLYL